MASDLSYTITLSNNKTEKAAIDYLLSLDDGYWVPDSRARIAILAQLQLPASFSRAFDLIRIGDAEVFSGQMAVADLGQATLIELKTTRKRLPQLPKGFFFGATENEFKLAELLGDRYRFCFVCLHPETPGYVEMTAAELQILVRTKRTQYQINL